MFHSAVDSDVAKVVDNDVGSEVADLLTVLLLMLLTGKSKMLLIVLLSN